ncbi:MAG: hypothetical protein J7L11_03275 [Thermoprotei archaeon]|nr:hypothetical protein [Thermoprotei archaeon]
MKKHLAIVIIAISLAAVITLAFSPRAISGTDSLRRRIHTFEGVIATITNSTIAVIKNNITIRLIAKGRWVLITDSAVNITTWTNAMGYISEGNAVVVAVNVPRGNGTLRVLIGLKQNRTILMRPILIRHLIQRSIHDEKEFTCTLLAKGDKLILVEARGIRMLAVIGGRWYKAGESETTWSNVSDEFRIGDRLWLCCERFLVLKPNFANLRIIVWGFSGAIIDIDSGTALLKVS